MRTIMIDGSEYASGGELHQALKRMLSLPDYYGMNADALNDCLSEQREPVDLWITGSGEGDTAQALRKVCAVIKANGGQVKEL